MELNKSYIIIFNLTYCFEFERNNDQYFLFLFEIFLMIAVFY